MCNRGSESTGESSEPMPWRREGSDSDETPHWPEEQHWPKEMPRNGRSFFRKSACLLWRKWTYSYMGSILRKGRRQFKDGSHLTQDDLYKVPSSMESRNLSFTFWSIYVRIRGMLLRTLWKLAAPAFVPAGFCQLLTVVLKISLPLLMKKLLRVLEDNPSQSVVKEGLPYVLLLFIANAATAFAMHREAYLANKSGVVLRAVLVNAIYDHAIRLSTDGRSELTTGEVTNLVAIDTQKLFEVTLEGHLVWSCPLFVVIVTGLLLSMMGPVTLVGIAVLVLFIPIVRAIVSRMMTIRKKRARIADHRIHMITSMLQGIKVTKLSNYEDRISSRVGRMRKCKMKLVRKELWTWAWTLVIAVISPVVATSATFATYVLMNDDNILTAANTFSVLLLFAILKFPINLTARLAGKVAQAREAARRIGHFLLREVRDKYPGIEYRSDSKDQPKKGPMIEVTNGSFVVGAEPEEASSGIECAQSNLFVLSNIGFSVSRSELIAVCGPVGSGKSTLVNALIGEVPCSPGTEISISGKMAVASQTPFILNATLRQNILFGSEFDEDLYERVLDACCLRPDISQLGPAGDLTEIGERGVTLSGGQKQRVSLARVAYAVPDVAIFDDPLSALDAGTAKEIFDRLFNAGDGSVLGSCAKILVTHATHFLNQVSRILVLVDGRSVFWGTWDELTGFESDSDTVCSVIEAMRSSVQDNADVRSVSRLGNRTTERKDHSSKCAIDVAKGGGLGDGAGKLMTIEEREYGLSSMNTWVVWFQNAGGWFFLLTQIFFLIIDRGAYVVTELWLALWTDAHDGPLDAFGKEFPPQTDGRSAQIQYVSVYSCIIAVSAIGTFSRSQWGVRGGARSAERLFSQMTKRVLSAPMTYFDTTPLGRILNRFTYDVEVMDITLTEAMAATTISISWFVAAVVVMVAILPWIVVFLIPIIGIQLYYRKTGPDLQRIDAVSRSPIQALLAEGLDGAATIRAFRMEQFFVNQFQQAVDRNSSAMLNFIAAQRWLGLRIELLGTIVVLISCLFVVIGNGTLNLAPGIVALLIICSINFTVILGFLFNRFSESEAAITSIERINATSALPQESAMETSDPNKVDPAWPTKGTLEFENVCLRYRNGLPLVLNDLSFRIEHGKRCGVVGRTGAGKSSLTTALFRLVEVESGRILLDGVDLSKLGLSDVRGRPNGISIIPQDPVLFAGSLRECLDPFGGSTDKAMVDSLVAVRLRGFERGLDLLDEYVEEGGMNFSVGERQLICMARAILAQPKVLVLDEATASVDGATDAFIQEMLRTRFQGTTLLTVAHRLHTIMDYDLVIVMDGGRAVEFGSPRELLELGTGAFMELVNSTGDEGVASLKSMIPDR